MKHVPKSFELLLYQFVIMTDSEVVWPYSHPNQHIERGEGQEPFYYHR